MAYSATQLAETQRNAYNADKPIALGDNALELIATSNKVWRSWNSSTYAGDNNFGAYTVASSLFDATDSTYPTSRLSDRFTHKVSRALKPNGITSVSNDRWSFICYFANGFSFDSVAILGHNFGTLSKLFGTANGGNAFTIKLGVSDDGSTWTTIATFTDPQTDMPITSFNLANGSGSPSTFASFTGVAYFGISIVCASSAMGVLPTTLPEISEVVIGNRFQFLHQAKIPYRDRETGNVSTRETGRTGASAVDIQNSGGRRIEGTFQLTSDKSDFVSFYQNDLTQGMLPFLYVPKGTRALFPSSYQGSEPGEAFWVTMQNESLSVEVEESYLDTTVQLSLRESAPYHSSVT